LHAICKHILKNDAKNENDCHEFVVILSIRFRTWEPSFGYARILLLVIFNERVWRCV